MSRKIATALLLMTILGSSGGCISGPFKLSRSWDDKVNTLYSENAWVHGALLQDIIPVYPIVGLFAGLGDILFVNPFYFWGTDAWSNRGTAFIHANPMVNPDHAVNSLAGNQDAKH